MSKKTYHVTKESNNMSKETCMVMVFTFYRKKPITYQKRRSICQKRHIICQQRRIWYRYLCSIGKSLSLVKRDVLFVKRDELHVKRYVLYSIQRKSDMSFDAEHACLSCAPHVWCVLWCYWVATVSRMDKIIGLLCRISSLF